MNICYVYKLTHIPSFNWYVGSRTAKQCHPNDGYMSSSKTVKQMIAQNPNEWTKTIIATGSKQEMLDLEREILVTVNAAADPRSFNKHNADSKFIENGWAARDQTGNNNVMRNAKTAAKVAAAKTNVARPDMRRENNPPQHSEKARASRSKTMSAKIRSEEHRKNMSIGMKNLPLLTCDVCGKQIRNSGNLKQHKQKIHDDIVTVKIGDSE